MTSKMYYIRTEFGRHLDEGDDLNQIIAAYTHQLNIHKKSGYGFKWFAVDCVTTEHLYDSRIDD